MYPLEWTALVALLSASAFLSASETALFALDESERARAGPGAARLLAEPEELLITVLLASLIVHVLYFSSIASLTRDADVYPTLAAALIALCVLVACGEILPKALALRGRVAFTRFASVPLLLLVRVFGPLRRVIQRCLELTMRALGNWAKVERGVSTESLAEVLGHSADIGLIEGREADLLSEVIELEGVRVKEIMTPRVDVILLDLAESDDEQRWFAIARALSKRITWLPVVRGSADEVVGQVRMRDLLAEAERPLEELVRPVAFVPEVASVLDLLNELRTQHVAEAVVVDEYGGTAGIVTVEHAFEEIVGDLRVEGEAHATPVVRLADGRFRVAGSLSIRDWNELFGRAVVPDGFETVGGLVSALLGRVPRSGDCVRTGGLFTRVHEVRGRRVLSVDLSIEGAELEPEPVEVRR